MKAEVRTGLSAGRDCAADAQLLLKKALDVPSGEFNRSPAYLAKYHLTEAVRLLNVALGMEKETPAPTVEQCIDMAKAQSAERGNA